MFAYYPALVRGIAQSGSAPALGAGCREFESLYPDHFSISKLVLYQKSRNKTSLFGSMNAISVLSAPVAHLDRASAF